MIVPTVSAQFENSMFYKHVDKKHSSSTFDEGVFQIGTLLDYTKQEHKLGIHDATEGSCGSYAACYNDSITSAGTTFEEPASSILKQYFKVEGNGGFFFRGGSVISVDLKFDCYVFCLSISPKNGLFYKEDACFKIVDINAFSSHLAILISKNFGHKVRLIHDFCKYGSKSANMRQLQWEELPFLKPEDFEYQKEYRLSFWIVDETGDRPIEHKYEPFKIEDKNLTQHLIKIR